LKSLTLSEIVSIRNIMAGFSSQSFSFFVKLIEPVRTSKWSF